MMVLCGISFSSLYCPAKTKVPSLMVMPFPGPLNISFHFGFLIWEVIFMGRDQVTPSSSLFTSINCPVSSGLIPDSELFQSICPGFPCAHKAITHTVFVKGSTKMEGSPMPFSASDLSPHSFMSMMIFIRRSEEHTSELQSRPHLVCRLLLEKKKNLYLSTVDVIAILRMFCYEHSGRPCSNRLPVRLLYSRSLWIPNHWTQRVPRHVVRQHYR